MPRGGGTYTHTQISATLVRQLVLPQEATQLICPFRRRSSPSRGKERISFTAGVRRLRQCFGACFEGEDAQAHVSIIAIALFEFAREPNNQKAPALTTSQALVRTPALESYERLWAAAVKRSNSTRSLLRVAPREFL